MTEAVVFGCGETARKYKEKILEQFHITAYTSNHPESWGRIIDGIAVISPKDIPENASVVVASKFYVEILSVLPQRYIEEKRLYVLLAGEIVPWGFGDFDENKLLVCSDYETRPTHLDLGLSNMCNSKCRYCRYHSEYSSSLVQGFMSEEVVDKILQQIRDIDSLRTLSLVGAGETMLHPQWQEIATRILTTYEAFEECGTYTNGMLLTRENAEKLKQLPVSKLNLIISIDGSSPEDCEYWRKGERFSVIRENVHRAYDILGDRAAFVINGCVVLPADIDVNSAIQVESYLQQSCEWRKTEFPFALHSNTLAAPDVDHIPGARSVHAAVFPKACTCRNPFSLISVFSNGDIISCPCGYTFQNDEEYRLGNVMTDQLADIFYHHEIYRGLRADLSNRKKPEVCGKCNRLSGNRLWCLQRTE